MVPAVATLKELGADVVTKHRKYHGGSYGGGYYTTEHSVLPAERDLLFQALQDKGMRVPAENRTRIGQLFIELVLREDSRNSNSTIIGNSLVEERGMQRNERTYHGTVAQNQAIFSAIRDSHRKVSPGRKTAGYGACSQFVVNRALQGVASQRRTEVVVLGAGPAGLMMTKLLVFLGVPPESITVIDRQGRWDGIWNQSNVVNGSKNNPHPIRFGSRGDYSYTSAQTSAAPGLGTDIQKFLRDVERKALGYHRIPYVRKGTVKEVRSGQGVFSPTTSVYWDDAVTGNPVETVADIVINCLGTGTPRPLSDRKMMRISSR